MIKKIYTYKLSFWIILLFLVVLSSKNATAQKYSEYDVKAAYVYNFAKFIKWPQNYFDKKDVLVIGVYKNQNFGEVLERVLENKKIKNKFWEIIFINTIDEIEECDILFVSNCSGEESLKVLKKVNKKNVLTIGNNIPKFCQYGGIINFTPKGSRKRFEINNNAAIKHKINISSKLLTLARIITKDEIEF